MGARVDRVCIGEEDSRATVEVRSRFCRFPDQELNRRPAALIAPRSNAPASTASTLRKLYALSAAFDSCPKCPSLCEIRTR